MNPASAGWQALHGRQGGALLHRVPGLDDLFLDDTWTRPRPPVTPAAWRRYARTTSAWHDGHPGRPAGDQGRDRLPSKFLWINSDDVSAAGYGGAVDGFMIENFATGWNAGQVDEPVPSLLPGQAGRHSTPAVPPARRAPGRAGRQSDTQIELYALLARALPDGRGAERHLPLRRGLHPWTSPSSPGIWARPSGARFKSRRPPSSATSPTARHCQRERKQLGDRSTWAPATCSRRLLCQHGHAGTAPACTTFRRLRASPPPPPPPPAGARAWCRRSSVSRCRYKEELAASHADGSAGSPTRTLAAWMAPPPPQARGKTSPAEQESACA